MKLFVRYYKHINMRNVQLEGCNDFFSLVKFTINLKVNTSIHTYLYVHTMYMYRIYIYNVNEDLNWHMYIETSIVHMNG